MPELSKINVPEQLIGNTSILTELNRLDFSTRVKNCLAAESLFYVIDVLSRSREELFKTPNFSHKSYAEIMGVLQEQGFTFPIDHFAISDLLKECKSNAQGDHQLFLNNIRTIFELPHESALSSKPKTPQKAPSMPVNGSITIDMDGGIECEFKLSPILKASMEEGIISAEQLNEIFQRHVKQANLEVLQDIKATLSPMIQEQ